jgi:hypothetical protein
MCTHALLLLLLPLPELLLARGVRRTQEPWKPLHAPAGYSQTTYNCRRHAGVEDAALQGGG